MKPLCLRPRRQARSDHEHGKTSMPLPNMDTRAQRVLAATRAFLFAYSEFAASIAPTRRQRVGVMHPRCSAYRPRRLADSEAGSRTRSSITRNRSSGGWAAPPFMVMDEAQRTS